MKRDMDLIRSILEQTEEVSGEPRLLGSHLLSTEDYSADAVLYHVRLLKDADFINGEGPGMGSSAFNIRELTWKGCEFLALTRNDTIWNQAKTILAEKGLDFAVSYGSELLAGLTLQMLKQG